MRDGAFPPRGGGSPSSSDLRFAVAACQTDFPCPRDRSEIGSRVDRMLEMVDAAVAGYRPFFPVRLLVFPEFAHAAPVCTCGTGPAAPGIIAPRRIAATGDSGTNGTYCGAPGADPQPAALPVPGAEL